MRQFTTAARRGQGAVVNSVDVDFEFEVKDGEFKVMTAHPPTSGQLALFMTDQTRGGGETVRSLFDFLAAVLDQDDYDIIEGKLREGLDLQVPLEIIQYLTEEWGARPTRPVSVSPSSPNSTGRRSTAKRRAAVSTTSRSVSTGS